MKVLKFNNSRENICAIAPPITTNSYTTISNKEIIDTIMESVDKSGLSIVNEHYKYNFKQFVGEYDIKADSSDFGIRIIFSNSYDKSMTFGLAIGANVLICSNGVVAGEVTLKRRHTGDARNIAIDTIVEGIQQVQDIFEETIKVKDTLQNVYIDRNIAAELVGKLLINENLLTTLQINILKTQLVKSQTFNTIDAPEFNMWDLYNHCTFSLKESHPSSYMSDHIKLHNFMMKNYV